MASITMVTFQEVLLMRHTKVTGYYTKWMTNLTVPIFFSLQRMKKKILPYLNGWQGIPGTKFTHIVGMGNFFICLWTRKFRKKVDLLRFCYQTGFLRKSMKRQGRISLFLYICSQWFTKIFVVHIEIFFWFCLDTTFSETCLHKD